VALLEPAADPGESGCLYLDDGLRSSSTCDRWFARWSQTCGKASRRDHLRPLHNSLAAATADLVRRGATVGRLPVVLTGGCFGIWACSHLSGSSTCAARQVPLGDGGIALGQALVADAGRS
jgi:hydrogenase maturation factor HypF (carbamoyltransferase family)